MSSTILHRRKFLNFGLNPGMNHKAHLIRPPWAIEEQYFQDACTRCGDCIEKCPEHILVREGPNGYPNVDFTHGECTFCADCVDVCPTVALNRSQPFPWTIKAFIGNACLPAQQVICTTCAEQCDAGAIHFKPVAGAVARPEINLDTCTGCGACVAPCPAQAIEVRL